MRFDGSRMRRVARVRWGRRPRRPARVRTNDESPFGPRGCGWAGGDSQALVACGGRRNNVLVSGPSLEGDQYAEAPKDMGTGVAGVWGQHHFMLTASHVLEGAEPGDLLAFCRPSGDLVYRTTSQVTIENSVPPVKCTDQDSKIHQCPWEDLAVVTTKASILGPDIEFVNIANSWIDPPEGETVHCVGYPTDNRVLVDSQRVGLVTHRSLAFYADVFSGDVLPCPSDDELRFRITAYDHSKHYIIPFEPANRGKHPRGISGAATWYEPEYSGAVWSPHFKFAGTCTSCYKSGTVEQVVRASVVHKFLEEVFGTPT